MKTCIIICILKGLKKDFNILYCSLPIIYYYSNHNVFRFSEVFDYVYICNGKYRKPNIVSFPQQEKFKGYPSVKLLCRPHSVILIFTYTISLPYV